MSIVTLDAIAFGVLRENNFRRDSTRTGVWKRQYLTHRAGLLDAELRLATPEEKSAWSARNPGTDVEVYTVTLQTDAQRKSSQVDLNGLVDLVAALHTL